MDSAKSAPLMQWHEPLRYYFLKRQIEKVNKSFIQRYWGDILAFLLMEFLILIVKLPLILNATNGTERFKEVVIIIFLGIVCVLLVNFFTEISGIWVKIFQDHIIISPKKPDYFPFRKVGFIKILEGFYKGKKYSALEIYNDKNNFQRVVFLSDKVSLNKIVNLLEEREIKCIFENPNNN